MTEDEHDIEALLARERARDDVPKDVVARIRAGAMVRIAALPLVGGGEGGSGSSGSGDAGAAPSGAPTTPTEIGGAPGVDSAGLAEFASRLVGPSKLAVWGFRVAIFAAGAGSGWVAHEAADSSNTMVAAEPAERGPSESASDLDASVDGCVIDASLELDAGTLDAPPPAVVPASTDATRPAPSLPSLPLESAPVEAPPASVDVLTAAHDAELAEERLLLATAQSALARGDAAGATAAINEHRRRFPSGRLVEEREALAVRALVRAGLTEQAHVRADAFRERWPRSLLRAVVDRASPPTADPATETGE